MTKAELKTTELKALGRPMGPYNGCFPHGFMSFLERKFGISNKRVLFPFGGTTESKEMWTVNDINEDLDVDTHHDATDLPAEWTNKFDIVVSDPPYNEKYAKEYYDVEYPRPYDHYREGARVVKEGGLLLILDWLVYQNYLEDKLKRKQPIAITCGPNTRIRVLNIFRKRNSLNGFLDKDVKK